MYIISNIRSFDIITGTLVVMVLVIVSMSCNRSELIFRSVLWNCFCFFRTIRDVVELGTDFIFLMDDVVTCVLVRDVVLVVVEVPTDVG